MAPPQESRPSRTHYARLDTPGRSITHSSRFTSSGNAAMAFARLSNHRCVSASAMGEGIAIDAAGTEQLRTRTTLLFDPP
jgi:hypothetical protein